MLKTALKVLKIIEDQGYEAYLVGGFVRDYLLGKESSDIDICTSATPKQLRMIFQNIVVPKDKYGSISVSINKVHFEITTFRKEIKYENNRFPIEIEYITKLEEDLQRRDFTINAICMNKQGKIIDLLHAKDDLKEKKINMIGNPEEKLTQDVLRMLRAIRFATILNFGLSKEIKETIQKYGHLLKELSYQRKKEELDKIFASKYADKGIALLLELNLEEHLELQNLRNIVITSDIIGIWSQLQMSDKYPFTSAEKKDIKAIRSFMKLDVLEDKNLYQYGLYFSTIVGEIQKIDRRKIVKRYRHLPIQMAEDIAVTADEICSALMMTPGKELKVILKEVETALLDRKVNNKKKDIISYLKKNFLP